MMVDGTRITTVSIHLDNLEQTLNSHYSLRRPWRRASESFLTRPFIWNLFPRKNPDRPFVGNSPLQNYVSSNETIACFKDATYATQLTAHAAHTVATPLIF